MQFSDETYRLLQTLFGSIGVVLSLFFGFFLLFKVCKRNSAYFFLGMYFILFGFRIGKSLLYGSYTMNNSYLDIFLSLLLAIGPLLWFFTKNLDIEDLKFKPSYFLLHFSPFILVLLCNKVIPVSYEHNS